MPFVNEYIPADDVKKYHIEEINKKVYLGFNGSTQWTIDRARDIYFRQVARGREEFRSETINTFDWKGRLIWLTLEGLSKEEAQQAEGERFGEGEPVDPRSRLVAFKLVHWSEDGSGYLSSELKARRSELIRDLKEALEASKGGIGVYASQPDRPWHVMLIVGKEVS
ncbi:hypothetical protein [Lacisediminimonas profundi]|uniref:hypothetical protein n=1 Tax=Lacisediminimonas profundi TaxID=2603856 RepID=UPI00124B0860|nr:hypothetical protein [Lacisediminimonas profundi]